MKALLLLITFSISVTTFSQKVKTTKKTELVTVLTNLGEVKFILFDKTPLHKANFLRLVKTKFYDSTTFHRVIDGFMIQGGDPNSKDKDPGNDGTGGNNYTIPAEFVSEFTHVKGAVAAARQGDQVNPAKESSGCQFYIVESDHGAHFLDKNYSVFGQVIAGMDVVEKIAVQQKDGRDRPLKDIKMIVRYSVLKKKRISKLYSYQFN